MDVQSVTAGQSIALLPENRIRSLEMQLDRIESAQSKIIHDANREFLYTEEDFCAILKCSQRTAQKYRTLGYIGFVQVGATIRYRKEDILAFCEKFKVKANFKG